MDFMNGLVLLQREFTRTAMQRRAGEGPSRRAASRPRWWWPGGSCDR